MSEQLLFTPEEAADVLRLGRTEIYALMKSGDLPSLKIGRRRRVTRAALSGFVAQASAGLTPARTSSPAV